MLELRSSLECDLKREIVNDLASAERSLEIVCFEISSAEVFSALRSLEEKGVTLSLLCERRKVPPELLRWADERRPSTSIRFSEPNEVFHTLHEKLILIDRERLVTGSFNLSNESLSHSIELLIRTDAKSLVECARRHLESLWTAPRATAEGGCVSSTPAGALLFSSASGTSPQQDDSPAKTIRSIVQSAEKEVRVFASHWIAEEFTQLLATMHRRGVPVRVVKDYSALRPVDGCSTVPVRVVRLKRGKMHIKAILVDGIRYAVGSMNLFPRSLYRDQEYIFFGEDPATADRIRCILDGVETMSSPVSRARRWVLRTSPYRAALTKPFRRISKRIRRFAGR